MEKSAIIVAVIAAVASVFGALFTYFSNRYNSKTDKTTSILEEQYLKVISPIHQALHIRDTKKMCDVIDIVIQENYYLLPDKLFDYYTDFREYVLCSKDTCIYPLETDFASQIGEFHRILRYKLGYSKIKITKKEKETEKLLASSDFSSATKYFYIVSFIISLISFIFAVLYFFKPNFKDVADNFLEHNFIQILIVAFICGVIISLKRFKR